MRQTIAIMVALACLTQAACSLPKFGLPRVHKVTIQQGNVITQRMIDQLRPGLTRSQVAFIMGEPIFRNTFDDSRWDYLYSIEIPGTFQDQKRLTVYFEGDVMTHFDGDFAPTEITPPEVPDEIIEDA
ncbi:MAG: outer membrane protein assembly factor BamE [Pseudomonadales bacterium]|nr:outer membrane protein assembly factor BamE [Pseudomonadales bacterium]